MKKKWTLGAPDLWNPGAVEQWLEHAAAKGWRLTRCIGSFASFTASEQKNCRVRVQPQEWEPKDTQEERRAAYAEMGWVYAANTDVGFEVYYCDDSSAPELHTDSVAYRWAWEKPLHRSWKQGWYKVGLAVALAVIWFGRELYSGRTVLEFLLTMNWAMLYYYLLVLPLLAVMGIRQLRSVWKARRILAADLIPDTGSHWKRDRKWQAANWLLFVGLFLMLVLMVFVQTWREPQPEYQVDPKTLTDQCAEDGWWITNIQNSSGLLAPQFSGMRQCSGLMDLDSPDLQSVHPILKFSEVMESGGQLNMDTLEVRTVHPALTKALYKEKRERFLESWPQAIETKLANDFFEEVLLLEGDAEHQQLMVLWETRLYCLRVDFQADLSSVLDGLEAAWTDGERA